MKIIVPVLADSHNTYCDDSELSLSPVGDTIVISFDHRQITIIREELKKAVEAL
jgi:hypothetical protein